MGVLVGSWLMKVALILVVSLYNINVTVAKDIDLEWEVEYKRWSPDGVEGEVITINGQFPGPTIRAHAGDSINIKLTNKFKDEGVVIHWHGIRQKGTPWADGTASISQCAIDPGKTYAYKFQVDKAGTFFYHGHYGMQRSAGLYGSLIVDVAEGEKEKFDYDEELEMILLSDWWHNSSQQQEIDLSSKPMRWIGEPQSLLINGRGQFGCSLAAHVSSSSATPCKLAGNEPYAPNIFPVRPNRTYRLRIASSTALATLNMAIGNHKMDVVEADGDYVQKFTVESIDIYSGESYSVLFTTDQDPSKNYWISINVVGREPHTPPGLAILQYLPDSPPPVGAPLPDSPSPVAAPDSAPSMEVLLPDSPLPETPKWDDIASRKDFLKKILARDGTPPPPPVPAQNYRRILLLNTQNYIDGQTKWSINNISLALPTTPYLGSIRYSLNNAFDQGSPPDDFNSSYDVRIPPINKNSRSGNGVYTLESGSTVDVILQNANILAENASEIHPWHLHGHDFWVLGYGEGKFSEDKVASFNSKNPPLRNTAVLFPHGWTALRFEADNPGVWAFHCHLEPHLHMGMGVVFAEGVDEIKKLNIPNDGFACGLTATVLQNSASFMLSVSATLIIRIIAVPLLWLCLF